MHEVLILSGIRKKLKVAELSIQLPASTRFHSNCSMVFYTTLDPSSGPLSPDAMWVRISGNKCTCDNCTYPAKRAIKRTLAGIRSIVQVNCGQLTTGQQQQITSSIRPHVASLTQPTFALPLSMSEAFS